MVLTQTLHRRELLRNASCGFGMLALAEMCRRTAAADGAGSPTSEPGPLAPKPPHFAPRAKHVIFLFMVGGPSQYDTFDHKPRLNLDDGKPSREKSKQVIGTPWKFAQRGESGLPVSELFPHVAEQADSLCMLHGLHGDNACHNEATLQLHTGSAQFVRPSLGAWTLYGLGTENQDLPGFISIAPRIEAAAAQCSGSAFLPAINQGTRIGNSKHPIAQSKFSNLANPRLSAAAQRKQLDLIQSLNRDRLSSTGDNAQLEGVIQSYELAFRMQSELPRVMDLSGETQATLKAYGVGEGRPTDNFGRQCLMARRFVESGVRFVEVCHEFWDHHTGLRQGLAKECLATDQPIAALLADLKQRDLLKETLVVWGGEFGRTPNNDKADGRGHNPNGYTMWLAGGGVKGGLAYGSTDEYGYEAVEGRVHLHDLHATILHLLGLDHEQLTYRYSGRDFRLTDVHGRVVNEILA